MTKDEALTLAREALIYCVALNRPVHEQKMHAITAIKKALAQPEQDARRLQIAMRQWEESKTYALELQKRLVKYEGGSPMILNTQLQEKNT